jgi:ABC-2 type transport system ATP-binding protein
MDIVVEGLTKQYGLQKAVDNISFRVKPGEILGFLGPNGAGKTTTMKAITGIFSFNAGEIYIGGKSINGEAEEVKKHIGYLPEDNELYSEMPVINYLRFMAEIQDLSKEKIPHRIRQIIRLTGLEKEKHKIIRELSKGYQQRVGLAQALIHDPEVLILDEPTTGLDPNQIVEIRELIKKIGQEKTVILSSHILAEVEATCDRIMIINNGKIVADGTSEELQNRARGKQVMTVGIEGGERNAVYNELKGLGQIEMVDFAEGKDGLFEVRSVDQNSPAKEIFEMCVRNDWYITQMTPVETKLEDIFRQLTMN